MRIDFFLAGRMRPVKLIAVRAKCKAAVIGLPAAGRGAGAGSSRFQRQVGLATTQQFHIDSSKKICVDQRTVEVAVGVICLLYTSPSPRDRG